MANEKSSATVGPYAIAHAGYTRRVHKQRKKSGATGKSGTKFVVYCPACSSGGRFDDLARGRMTFNPANPIVQHTCGLRFRMYKRRMP